MKFSPITFTFNGMLKTNEIAGEGNSFSTEFRQYDPRLGKWLSLDPLMEQFPWMSPFVGFDNNPILYIDPYGLNTIEKDTPAEGGEGENKGGEHDSPKDGLVGGSQAPKDAPENPCDGDVHTNKNGKYTYDSNSGSWTKEMPTVTINNKPKEKKDDSYKGFKGVSLGGFDWSANQAQKRNKNSPYYDDWMKTQRKWETFDKGVETYMYGALSLFGGGAVGSSLIGNIIVGSSSNFVGQASSVNNPSKIDYFDVAVSGATAGIFKNPWKSNLYGSILEGGIDIDGKGNISTIITDKSINKFTNDVKWGLMGGVISNRNSALWGSSSRVLNSINFGIEAGAEFLNNKTDENIK